jgi:hypothetical protein
VFSADGLAKCLTFGQFHDKFIVDSVDDLQLRKLFLYTVKRVPDDSLTAVEPLQNTREHLLCCRHVLLPGITHAISKDDNSARQTTNAIMRLKSRSQTSVKSSKPKWNN